MCFLFFCGAIQCQPSNPARYGKDFFELARTGQVEALRSRIQAGADPNVLDSEGLGLLAYAVIGNQEGAIDSLLSLGANPNADGGRGLWLACNSSRTSLAIRLLKGGADVNVTQGQMASTPLREACHRANVELVQALLNCGANPDCEDRLGWTPLMLAAQQSEEIVELLLRAGASPARIDNQGRTALFFAAAEGRTAILRRLSAAGAPLNATDGKGETALFAAYRNGQYASARALLDLGADPEITNRAGKTARECAKDVGVVTGPESPSRQWK
jgi:ankyrin repeat protein